MSDLPARGRRLLELRFCYPVGVEPHAFLHDLATVLGVAAITTVVFQKLKQPVVLGYLLAGLVIGPHVPVPLVADLRTVQTLSELGVILLMFSVGLEFRIRKLLRLAPNAGLVGVLEIGLMFFLGASAAALFGWTSTERIYAGAIVAISSTTIVVKAFDAQRVGGHQRALVLGVLVIEDLVAVLLLAALAALSAGGGLSGRDLALTLFRLFGFLGVLLVAGLLLVPRLFRAVVALGQPETTLVAAIGVCFATALLAQRMGYSVALGAFVAGMLLAESGKEHEIERLVHPVRDLFGAVFFVSVGMLIDPALVWEQKAAIALFFPLVLVGKIIAVSLGGFLAGNGVRTALQAGFSLAQIGEFSFILAALGTSLGAIGPHLYPMAVATSALTALTTPALVRHSGGVADWVDRTLPRPLQTFAALYGSWLERLRASSPHATSRLRRLLRLFLLDALLVVVLAAGSRLAAPSLSDWLQSLVPLGPVWTRAALRGAGFLLALPLLWGILNVTHRIGALLAERVLAEVAPGAPDPAASPRRVLAVALQFGLILLVGVPLLAVTQPLLPPLVGVAVLLFLLAVVLVGLWRSASDLQGHVRAGAQVIVDVIAAQGASGAPPDLEAEGALVAQVHRLLPGLGEPEPARLVAGANAVGKSLRTLNLRGRSGATVLGIARGGTQILLPDGAEVLQAGDVVALAGATEAIAAARTLLAEPV